MNKQEIEQIKAALEHMEARLEEQRSRLDRLSEREREDLYWNLRKQERHLKIMRSSITEIERHAFARDVLRDLQAL